RGTMVRRFGMICHLFWRFPLVPPPRSAADFVECQQTHTVRILESLQAIPRKQEVKGHEKCRLSCVGSPQDSYQSEEASTASLSQRIGCKSQATGKLRIALGCGQWRWHCQLGGIGCVRTD